MATRTTKNATPNKSAAAPKPPASTPKRTPVTLEVVIDELNLILSLSDQSPDDPFLRELVIHAKEDFEQAIKGFPGGDGLPDIKDPQQSQN
jgi:hypothetical protein